MKDIVYDNNRQLEYAVGNIVENFSGGAPMTKAPMVEGLNLTKTVVKVHKPTILDH